jgi:hypothetical protein
MRQAHTGHLSIDLLYFLVYVRKYLINFTQKHLRENPSKNTYLTPLSERKMLKDNTFWLLFA